MNAIRAHTKQSKRHLSFTPSHERYIDVKRLVYAHVWTNKFGNAHIHAHTNGGTCERYMLVAKQMLVYAHAYTRIQYIRSTTAYGCAYVVWIYIACMG